MPKASTSSMNILIRGPWAVQCPFRLEIIEIILHLHLPATVLYMRDSMGAALSRDISSDRTRPARPFKLFFSPCDTSGLSPQPSRARFGLAGYPTACLVYMSAASCVQPSGPASFHHRYRVLPDISLKKPRSFRWTTRHRRYHYRVSRNCLHPRNRTLPARV
jgi:hypothetical protein